ncbi:MAG TPA: gliding motility-associated C-terminal domain-containing protein [Cytophagaceae bacterium]|nr:gliding motility-associated C-terminal domain-containing protein [Cytophagaceae bacterium]
MRTFLISLFFLIFSIGHAYCTHLKAGDITAERIPGGAFRFTLTIYLDSLALVANSSLDEPQAIFTVNGTSTVVNRLSMISVGNGTWRNTYILDNYVLSPGTYTISYTENFRNKNILNINGGTDTDNVPFYIETKVNFDPFMGLNRSPVLLLPPIDVAVAGQKYIHNPSAFDFEGDSISYQLVQPKQSGSTNVPKYVNPNLVTNTGTFTLDPVTGDMIWNTPERPGLYNVAFLITEWRNGEKLTIIERDMQIKVVPSTNRPPVLGASIDTCIVAGTGFTKTITATDPDGDPINLISTNSPVAGVYAINPSPATFNLTNGPNPESTPASGVFSWNTTCAHIRSEPYQVEFRATDVPAVQPPLSDLQYIRIKVVGPSPTGFNVTAISGGFNLSWNTYACNTADKMQIFRRECDSTALVVSNCQTGIPAGSGFVKIAEVPVSQRSYKDTVNLKHGNKYCYVIAASFPTPSGGESLPSAMDCGTLLLDEPVLLNVSIDSTSISNGRITVRWAKPQVLPLPGPYEYIVFRASGLTGKKYFPIDTITNLNQTSIIDSTVNTLDSVYNYIVKFYYNNGLTFKGATDPFSTVQLTAKPGSGKVFLSWTSLVPYNHIYFRIYKYVNNVPVLFDSIPASGKSGSYIDTGLINKVTVCYFVETVSRYCDLNLLSPLVNRSQKICETPRDSTPPCPPTLFIKPIDCAGPHIFKNDLNWINNLSASCNHDIMGYNLYYTQYEGDVPTFIKFIPSDTFYADVDSLSLSGCYEVTAINYYGVESARSNRVCMDNCSFYKLPNLITPNGDLSNDSFRPYPVPRNVEQVNFFVYNRWGKLVYHSNNDINLNWRGVSGNGDPLADGVYYFLAEVKFYRRLRKDDENLKLKGWVEIVNSNEASGR